MEHKDRPSIILMTPAQWNGMTKEQKVAHFECNDVECMEHPVMNTKAKFTDPVEKKIVMWHQAVCGGVIVSKWKRSEQDALDEAAKNIATELQWLLSVEDSNQLTID